MPKDPSKNVDRYKIRGGTLNEFEVNQNQEAYEEQKSKKGGAKAAKGTARGASAKKLAARKTKK